MREDIESTKWPNYFKEYTLRNDGRPTRLEVRGRVDEEDFWLECGLPLIGIDIDTHDKDTPRVEIMLGGGTAHQRDNHVTRSIACVRRVTLEKSADGRDQGLEIEDADAVTTILWFEVRDA